MGNPYTSVSILNFNASPPADDASQVSGNQVEWQKHLDKLATPLKNLAESINTNNVTAHGRHLGQTFETKTAPYTIAAPGDRGKFFDVTGTTTITLPAAVDAGDGFPVGVINNGSAVVTVDGNASELINGSTSITLDANDALVITCDGSSWVGFIIRADVQSIETGSFTVNWTGFTTSPSTVFNFTRVGAIVTLHANTVLSATSNATTMASAVGEVPASLRPTEANVKVVWPVRNSGVLGSGFLSIDSAGTLSLFRDFALTNFDTSGSKGHALEVCATYLLD